MKKILETNGLTPDSIEGKFTFKLEAQNNAPVPAVVELSNPDADGGKVTFGAIAYTEPGIYEYTVTETGSVPGIANDAEAAKKQLEEAGATVTLK